MSLYQPLCFRPKFYWDETAGLQEEKPMLLKLVQSSQPPMPSKCPSVFAFTVGYTIPFNAGSHYALWRVLPSALELRQNTLIFTPAFKEKALKPVPPEQPKVPLQEPPAKPEKEEPKQPPEKPQEAPPAPESNNPSFVVKLLNLPLSPKSQPAIAVGVTFVTQHDNHRLVWNLLPSSEALAQGVLLLDPWEGQTEEAANAPQPKRWWQRP